MNKIAWVFPGQGAQKAGMGQDFYNTFPAVKEIYDKASDLLGLDMVELCFTKNDKLDITEYTQAALVTTCVSIARVMEAKGLKPDVTAGLSLGEYCAIALAGGISDEEAIRIVRIRGQLMQNAMPPGVGGMAAIMGLSREALLQTIASIEGVTLANENCPGQLVITGYAEAVKEACKALKEAGARGAIPLKVSGAFHSPLQEKAGIELYNTLHAMEFKELQMPYITNVTGEAVQDEKQIGDLLRRQVSSPVLWQKSVETMIAMGVDTFVEIGPGTTLTGCIRKINKEVKTYNIGTVSDLENYLGEA